MNVSLITLLGILSHPIVSSSEYKFKVFPTERCPMNNVEWDMASARLNCNKSFGYHCVPNKYLTSLIEFCYPRGYSLLFKEGNCLELAADGILNHVPCNKTFYCGCPNSFYLSREIYKHPMCLSINPKLQCFNADIGCISSRYANNTTEQDLPDVKSIGNDRATFAMSIVFGISTFILTTCIVLIALREKCHEKYQGIPQQEMEIPRHHLSKRPKNQQLVIEEIRNIDISEFCRKAREVAACLK